MQSEGRGEIQEVDGSSGLARDVGELEKRLHSRQRTVLSAVEINRDRFIADWPRVRRRDDEVPIVASINSTRARASAGRASTVERTRSTVVSR